MISKAIKELVGFHDGESLKNDPGETLSTFMIAGPTLEAKLKANIWSKEYIDLGVLVPKCQEALNIQYDLGNLSQISLTSSKVRQAVNIFEWHKWFTIYAAVYTQKFKDKAPAIITYITHIFNLRNKFPNTYIKHSYDKHFRKVRAFAPIP